MELKETLNEGLKRAYVLTLTAEELDNKVTEKLKEAAPKVALKGFRKGKVPMSHLRQLFGKSVLGEALQESIDSAIGARFAETGDHPAFQPEIKLDTVDLESGQDAIVHVAYEVLPEINEPDYSKITTEKINIALEDAAIAESLDELAKNAPSFSKRRKGSKARSGDQLVIDFVGSLNGVEFEGGKGEAFPLTLGSGSFIPGFEDQLIDAKEGDETEVKVTFPENYNAKHLAGQDAVFKVTVNAVNEPEGAAIDDALAKRFGANDLDDLKGQIKERLTKEYDEAARLILKRRLMDSLDGVMDFVVPEKLLDAETQQIAHQLWHEAHPEDHGHNHGTIEPTGEHKKLALRRVRLGLLLAEIGKKNEIRVTEEEMRQSIMKHAQGYGSQAGQFLQYLQKNPQAQESIRAPIYEDKVVDFILSKVAVTEKTLGKEEFEKTMEALNEF